MRQLVPALTKTALLITLACLLAPAGYAVSTPNPGDPLFCQPQEGVQFLITNSGSAVWTADPDCFNNNTNNDTTLSITTSQGGTLTGTRTATSINYVYTPPEAGFTGLDTFTFHVTTVWNGAGGTGSAGGTGRPGGPADLTITLNVLPATTTLTISGPTTVPVPAGSISGCTTGGSPGLGPAAGAVYGCATAVTAGSVSPSHGTLRASGLTLRYTPTSGYGGPDTFSIRVLGVNCDGATALDAGDEVTVTATVLPPPVVTRVSPANGSSGTAVTITGTGFTGATTVKFGTTAATSFTVVSDTTITVTAPSSTASGNVDVTVIAPTGTSATSSADQFAYPIIVPTSSSVPTLSEWGMFGLAMLLGGTGYLVLRRRFGQV